MRVKVSDLRLVFPGASNVSFVCEVVLFSTGRTGVVSILAFKFIARVECESVDPLESELILNYFCAHLQAGPSTGFRISGSL